MSYNCLLEINKIDFSEKRVLIIGAGWMSDQFCNALTQMRVKDVAVISRTKESSAILCDKYGYRPYCGGYHEWLPKLGQFDLVIISTPIHELKSAAQCAVENGATNILIEKPGSLYSAELSNWQDEIDDNNVRLRIAYNRFTYPNYHKLQEHIESDGGITSCRYTFTELINSINFKNNLQDTYHRWGISNSLHVISMAHELIGLPREFYPIQQGSLEWHPSGERFVGAGITQLDIPFSYHADWGSAGRWGIEIMTPKYAYRLMPLEQLYHCKNGSFIWDLVETKMAYPTVKQGVAEEIAIMLKPELEQHCRLVDLRKAYNYNKLAENIFGYSNKRT